MVEVLTGIGRACFRIQKGCSNVPASEWNSLDGNATRPERKKENGEPAFDLSGMLPPNEVVDTALGLAFVAFDRVGNLAPLRPVEWAIEGRRVVIPYTGLEIPLGVTVRLTEGIATGLQTAIRHGEATLRKEGRTFIVTAPVLLKLAQFNYTLEFQALFLNFRGKVRADVDDILVDMEARMSIELPHARSVEISKFEILNVEGMKVRLEGSEASGVNRFLDIVVRQARRLFPEVVHDFLEPIGKYALEKSCEMGFQMLNKLDR
ncbi:unnamed protein product [Darwinula stevensoni]|uniref:Uncharacterized protein n=1 Tax=Darwinula stevensoni TaxID=69355 RepID=A0A7R8X764_9CRUS|nr:unnamed protein product [Darwinula stevensoni]CAG0882228.1 unnamed protein product [Darwinula stevensoni]